MDELDDFIAKTEAELAEVRAALAKAKALAAPTHDFEAQLAEVLARAQTLEAEADDLALTLERKRDLEQRLDEELTSVRGTSGDG